MSTRLQQAETQTDLWGYVEESRPMIERALLTHLPTAPARVETLFNDALHYALFPGGKRLRPVLSLLGAELVGGSATEILAAAVAVEYLHTSSLIFDDLPCMDNAIERRGRSPLHMRYGEGLAVLVALALMNASYGLIFAGPVKDTRSAIRAHAELVECIGASGMVAGQSVDLAAVCRTNSVAGVMRETDDALRNLKTSALIRLSVRVGAILCGAGETELDALSRFAALLGEAYQTGDDVLDLQEDAALTEGAARRATFALERGAHDARRRINALTSKAKSVLWAEFGETRPAQMLCQMADYIAERVNLR